MRVLVAGHVNWDVTLRVDRIPCADDEGKIRSQRRGGGGSAANVALALATLDLDPTLLASVGDDDPGRSAREELSAAGVDCRGLRTVEGADTSTKYVLVDDNGEVAVLGNDGVNEAIGPEDIDPDLVRTVDHVHLTSQRPETAARIADVARNAAIPVSFDPGRRLGDRSYSAVLERVDIVFVNDREAKRGLGPELDDPDLTVIVKQGEEGATVHGDCREQTHPGFGVDAVDTAGAGDAFAAGYLATWLREGDIEAALAVGNACGALVATREGARTAPTEAAIQAFLDEHQ